MLTALAACPSALDTEYDLIVIGGGIHGAGVAQAAAARGWSVLVLEQTGLASGTSSRSSKLIHGGLRYLESGQFALVRECLHERALLLRLAPELVHLRPFHIPVYRQTSRRPWQLRIGLTMYAAFAAGGPGARFHRIPRMQWPDLDGLATGDLEAVFCYYDGQTDDAALTRAVMRSARNMGAVLRAPARFLGAELREGVTVHYREGGVEYTCRARVLVNAAGPWVNHVLQNIEPRVEQIPVDLVQGTHLVLPGALEHGIYYVEAPRDGRAVFVMPWRGQTLLGTTETVYTGDPAAVRPLPGEIEYLLETFRHYFPGRDTTVLEAFAGLRVLPAASGSPFGRSRETLLHTGRAERPRLLTIYGGKLTGYRLTAEKVMTRIEASLPPATPAADTREIPLTPDEEDLD